MEVHEGERERATRSELNLRMRETRSFFHSFVIVRSDRGNKFALFPEEIDSRGLPESEREIESSPSYCVAG